MKLGLQMYTVKDDLASKGIVQTYTEIAGMGYQGVEFGSTGGLTVLGFADLLRGLGLEACGVMRSGEELEANLSDAMDLARATGARTLLVPGLWGPRFTGSLEAFKRAAVFLDDIGRRCRAEGFGFQYHIHGQEFEEVGGTTGMEILLCETSPENLNFEVDTYWVDWAKDDALSFSKRIGSRLGAFHLKDYRSREDMTDVEIGTGALDVPALLEVGRAAGIEWVIVEQEQFDKPQLEAAALSAKYLKELLA